MDENRMYEVMVEMLAEQRITNQELGTIRMSLTEMSGDVAAIKGDVAEMKGDIAQLKEVQIKHNLELQMLNRSMLKISDQLDHFAEHENRIRHIETILKIA